MPRRRVLVLMALLLAQAAAAQAGPGKSVIPCGAVEPGVILVDGILEDWHEVPSVDVGAGDDFALHVKCNYDREWLYLVADVRDDALARTKIKAGTNAPEDHVTLFFADGARLERLHIYPGDAVHDVPRVAFWASGDALAKEVQIADALQARGWAVELRMPLRLVPGWSPGVPSVPFAVAAYDADAPAKPTIEKTLSTSPTTAADKLGGAEFAESANLLDSFLRDRKLTARDVIFDRTAKVFPTGRARVIVAGRTLAFLTDEYVYMDLPVESGKDILETRLLPLTGDGQESVVIRYREITSRGTREVLAAFRGAGDGLRRTLAIEIGKQSGDKRLACRATWLPRGGAHDLVIEPQPATGWTESNYKEDKADDVLPILLPWTGEKRARYQFRGDEYFRAE